MNRSFPRRRFLGLTLAGLASALPPGESRAAAPVEITVMAYGVDAFDEKYMRTVIRRSRPRIRVSWCAITRSGTRAMPWRCCGRSA